MSVGRETSRVTDVGVPASPSGNKAAPGRTGGRGGSGGKVAARLGQLCGAAEPPARLTGTPSAAASDREEEDVVAVIARQGAQPGGASHPARPRPAEGRLRPGTPHPQMPPSRPTGPATLPAVPGRGSGKKRGERESRTDARPPGGSRTFSSSMSRFVDLSMERN